MLGKPGIGVLLMSMNKQYKSTQTGLESNAKPTHLRNQEIYGPVYANLSSGITSDAFIHISLGRQHKHALSICQCTASFPHEMSFSCFPNSNAKAI